MSPCLKANLLTAIAMLLIAHGISNMFISRQDAKIAAQDARLSQYQDQANNEAVIAKRLELQALETARVAEKELADAKKKLAGCKN